MPATVLMIDDDPALCELLGEYLRNEGFTFNSVHSGEEGVAYLKGEHSADVVVLDIMMSGISGLDVLREIRPTINIPVIMLTGRGDDIDRILGLEMGADDYLAKPFSPRELLARIKAVLRRGAPRDVSKDRVVIRDLVIDLAKHEVRIGDEIISLTSTEFKLLHHLAASRGRAFSREQLLNKVVGMGVVVVDRNIDVHIRAVRKKLGNHSNMIQTIRGVGYRFVED